MQSTSDSSADACLPWGRSQWDRLAVELRVMVLRRAGPLTRFLCGLLGTVSDIDDQTARAIWHDAATIDWHGDLRLLPDLPIDRQTLVGLECTRSMYGRLLTRFPPSPAACSIHAGLDKSSVDTPIECDSCLHHIPMRRGWFDLVDCTHPVAVGWVAIHAGHADMLRHVAACHGVDLAGFGSVGTNEAVNIAAFGGSVSVLQMLHDAGSRGSETWAMVLAAGQGHLAAVEWLHEHGYGCTHDAMDDAAEQGHLAVMQWLYDHGHTGAYRAMELAAGNGHLDAVEWLLERGYPCSHDAMDDAAHAGHMAVVACLHKRGFRCSTAAMDGAAAAGRLGVVEWLHEHGYGCTKAAMDGAAHSGHLAVMQWLHANRTEGCTHEAVMLATAPDVAAWLRTAYPAVHAATVDMGDDGSVEWLFG